MNPNVPTKILVDMAEFVLSNNYFEFDDKIYHQQKGTAIGTKFALPVSLWTGLRKPSSKHVK